MATRPKTELFFSRRIGIGEDGREIPILGGARISGKVSDSVSIGVLNMQTDTVGQVVPGNNFTVARVYRDLPNSSQIGALFVNRVATGALGGADDSNQTYAVDGRLGLGQNGQIAGFVARTQTPGRGGRRPRVQRGLRLQLRDVAFHARLCRGRGQLQSGSRLPASARIP